MQKYFEKLYRENSTEFYKVVCKDLQNSQKAFIITANPETFMMGQENKNFGKVLESKNTIIILLTIIVLDKSAVLLVKIT